MISVLSRTFELTVQSEESHEAERCSQDKPPPDLGVPQGEIWHALPPHVEGA